VRALRSRVLHAVAFLVPWAVLAMYLR